MSRLGHGEMASRPSRAASQERWGTGTPSQEAVTTALAMDLAVKRRVGDLEFRVQTFYKNQCLLIFLQGSDFWVTSHPTPTSL